MSSGTSVMRASSSSRSATCRAGTDPEPTAVGAPLRGLGRRVLVRERFLEGWNRQTVPPLPDAQPHEIDGGSQPLGLLLGVGAHDGDPEDGCRLRERVGRDESGTVRAERGDRHGRVDVVREREAHPQLRGDLRAVVAGTQHPELG